MARRPKPYEGLAVHGPTPPRRSVNRIVAVSLATAIFVACGFGVAYRHASLEHRGPTAPTATAATPARSDSLPDTLSRQAGAVAAGDETAWLAPVDPTDTALVNQYKALYDRLRALDVTGLDASVLDHFVPPCCTTNVYYGVCLQVDSGPRPRAGVDL